MGSISYFCISSSRAPQLIGASLAEDFGTKMFGK
jgi:hypothetical protein